MLAPEPLSDCTVVNHRAGSGARPTTLAALIDRFALTVRPDVDLAATITGLTDDSRDIEPGSVFVARRGSSQDGLRYIPQAVAAGAIAVVVDAPHADEAARAIDTAAAPSPPVLLITPSTQALLPDLAEWAYGSPSSHLALMGVTGTNGKTTTASLFQQYINALGARRSAATADAGPRRCGLIGTIATDDGARVATANLTTPSAPQVSALLARMVANGCTHAAMEVSSHALDQRRTAGLRFRIAVFTNLTGDHLDYHQTMDAYAAAKALLLEGLEADAVAIVNAEDPWSSRMIRDTRATVIRCHTRGGPGSADADRAPGDRSAPSAVGREGVTDCHATVLEAGLWGSRLRLTGPWGAIDVSIVLPGLHNAMNVLQATVAFWVAADRSGARLDRDTLRSVVEGGRPPAGRLEPVRLAAPAVRHPVVLVDYAHTDDALINVLDAVRAVLPDDSRLGVVFGCGGDRDRTKRPRMARVACDRADFVCVTSDNPRTEDPLAIIGEILRGVPETFDRARLLVEADRARAIDLAIRQCRDQDVLVIAGKGHEDYQIVGTTKRPFDDREIARQVLDRRVSEGAAASEPKPVVTR